ncbi:BTAD domain-containing putative transcriptional regulator [Embleya sp. MST-111070]|uniref:BTAD domain-containing putative transcriptional regulator n=1 Tax=Embleya sp. MST-111070 TaxID=3398231 RepID=UPI003F7397BE
MGLVAGAPIALYLIGHALGGYLPGREEIGLGLLLRPDDGGGVAFAVLLAVGWACWLMFIVSLALEIPPAMRGRTRRHRVRGLGWSQHLAAVLLGGLVISASAGAAIAAPGSASAVSVSAPQTAGAEPTAAPVTARTAPSGPTHLVAAGETLWSVAEERLGDGTRWQEVVDVNQGRRMADGSILSAESSLRAGWTLALPADALPKAPAAPAAQRAAAHEVVVERGDTLSEIAEETLGDGDRYPEIFVSNKGRPQPDGGSLTDPDLIQPGWVLTVPGDTAAPAVETTTEPEERIAPETGPPKPVEPTAPQAPPPTAPADRGSTAEAPSLPAPGSEATVPPPGQQPPIATPAVSAENEDGGISTAAVIAATSLTAAAILAALGARRAHQQRRRRPRRRIPMPAKASGIDEFEHRLRVSSDVGGLELVDRSLRTLAANCARLDLALPDIAAVRVDHRGVELHLEAPVPPLKPFVAVEGHPDRWWCPARGADLLDETQARDVVAPYPALVSIGQTESEEPVLIDLERIGLLRLTGDADDVRAVMLALAVELGSSRIADDLSVVLHGAGEGLAGVMGARVEHSATVEEAVEDLVAHDAFQSAALGDHSLRTARLREDGGDAWVPKVLITPVVPGATDRESLRAILNSRPRGAVALVGTAGDLTWSGEWTISATPGAVVTLPGLDLSVVVQRLGDRAYEQLLGLLATAERSDDVPAPEWTHAPDGRPAPNGPAPASSRNPDVEVEPVRRGVVPVSVTAADGGVTAMPNLSALSPAVVGPSEPGTGSPRDQERREGPRQDENGIDFDEVLGEVLDEASTPGTDFATNEATGDTRTGVPQHDPSPVEPPYGEPAYVDAEDDVEPPFGEPVNVHTDEADPTAGVAGPARVGQTPPRSSVSRVLIALDTPPDPPAGPQIRVLGSVDVIGTLGKVESNRRNSLTEIAAWLALYPGKTRYELDEAIWPSHRVSSNTRNTSISKLRTWLGRDPLLPKEDPQAVYLPTITDGTYAYNDQVGSDWDEFRALYRDGMHSTGTKADVALARALGLVRGRPFADIDPSRYIWAERDTQEMISAIVDVAHELAMRRLAVRDYRAAVAAVTRGLTCDPHSELLYRLLFTLYSETGDQAGLERTAHQLTRISMETGCDSAPETVALINAVMRSNRIASA